MPIFATKSGLVYFAHVPKCAGTAVTIALKTRFGQGTAMFDSGYRSIPPELRWNRSSPQHIEAVSLAKLLPQHLFAFGFSVIRHPVMRLRSAYLYNRDIEELIDPEENFSTWLRKLPKRRKDDPWYLDNHARPINEMVPGFCEFFRVEDGLGRLLNWLDETIEPDETATQIEVRHTLDERMKAKGKIPKGEMPKPTPEDIAFIAEIDQKDFERFGYPADPADLRLGMLGMPSV